MSKFEFEKEFVKLSKFEVEKGFLVLGVSAVIGNCGYANSWQSPPKKLTTERVSRQCW